MRRRLTNREIILLIVLLVLVLASSYYLFFFAPRQEERDLLDNQILSMQDELKLYDTRLTDMKRMEGELDKISSGKKKPVSMAPYDNVQNVMLELHAILGETQDYSLNFDAVDTDSEDGFVRRNISLQFESDSYDAAKNTLSRLATNPNRCMFDNLSISIQTEGSGQGGWWYNNVEKDAKDDTSEEESQPRVTGASVSGSMVFFEYLPGETEK